jgi:protein-L-isoaspartate(D-aspartate) O-methyltransferase
MTRSPTGPRFPATLGKRPSNASTVLRPQAPLHHAQHAAHLQSQQRAPSGLGLDSAAVRARMVQRLRAAGLADERVLHALATVERHRFVDSALANQAYEDTSLPIGLQQTISKPSVVGHMLALLFEGAHAREQGHLGQVLEIGTGCGYQAALLMHLARGVVSVERLAALHDKAREHLAELRRTPRLADVRLVLGDGRLGHPPRAPYHSILAAAGGQALPQAWLDQLAPGGRLVAPVQRGAHQRLVVVDRGAQGLVTYEQDAVHFVPLKSGIE